MDTWFHPCHLVAVEGDHLRIGAPNKLHRDWVFQHHWDVLQTAAREALGGQPRLSLVVGEENPSPTPAPPPPSPAPRGGRVEGLNPRYTFDSFVVGSSNQFAQAASQAVGELPSRAYNPLFIYGGVGLGKTHLLHAIGHQVLRRFPQMAVQYLSSERFTNDLINAIRYDRTADFPAKDPTIDLLLIDD